MQLHPDMPIDNSRNLPFPRDILEIIAGAFELEPEESFHKLLLFPVLERGDKKWGFLIVTRKVPEDRLELAAYSYEIDSGGTLSKSLESRKAHLPLQRLDEVLDGLILRMDDLECNYQDVDLTGAVNWKAQLEHLGKLLPGEPDGQQNGQPTQSGGPQLQPGDSPEHGPGPGHSGS